jgi:molybdopterin-containing oxidoreductase family membrane subunit
MATLSGHHADAVTPPLTMAGVTEAVCRIVEEPPKKEWWQAFGLSAIALFILIAMVGYLISTGIGVWGLNNRVGWAWDITNFVFWVGIGHAGTLISAILYLFRQNWRTSINRAAEAMTIFAVICALLFPTIHVGRIWVIFWTLPYPNAMSMWPQFRSPLLWDVFAVSTYFTISLLFWYMGMVPDLATIRDRATTKLRRMIYGILSLGWRGSARNWHTYERAYLLLAALSTPLVLSVHSVVSFDFAVSILPGWHTTIFPPYFVAGAIFSGFAMVNNLLIPCRKAFGLEKIITIDVIEKMNKVILATGMMVGYAYGIEFWTAWYSGNQAEEFIFFNRAFGPYWWAYWTMVTCNVIVPQIFWSRSLRRNLMVTMIASVFVNIGMWFERFVIIVTSLHRTYLPSSWGMFYPTWVDILTLLGSFGLFFTLFMLFLRFVPMVAMAEVKAVLTHHPTGHSDPEDAPTVHAAGPGHQPAMSWGAPAKE